MKERDLLAAIPGPALLCGFVSSRSHQQPTAGQDVVGQCKPMQHGTHFLTSSNSELVEPPLSQASIDAFTHPASLEDAFAVRAFHAFAPGGNSRTVLGAR